MRTASKSSGSAVELHFSAHGLQNMDILGKSDPYVVLLAYFPRRNSNNIYSRSKKHNKEGDWHEIGRTEIINNQLSPVWAQFIEVLYKFEEEQNFRVQVFDSDTFKDDDLIGEAAFTLASVLRARNNSKTLKLFRPSEQGGDLGVLNIRGLQKERNKEALQLILQGENFPEVFFNTCCASVSQYQVWIQYEDTYKLVYTSPRLRFAWRKPWKQCSIDLPCETVVDDTVLRFKVFQTNTLGFPCLVGDVHTTVYELRRATSLRLEKNAHVLAREKLLIKHAKVVPKPSFLEYVSGGCEIAVSVAIDFTASNGHPENSTSLHSVIGSCFNPYEIAIQQVCSVVEQYDSDGNIPVFGFGAYMNGRTSHCFNVTLDEECCEVYGTQGVLDAYRNCIREIELSGPTNFAPVIRQATQQAMCHQSSRKSQKYSILLIITDGIITDMGDTVDAIVDAAEYAMSIVIVGVGDADFGAMHILDGDDCPLVSSDGVQCKRDIVQFVPFQSAKEAKSIATETLQEIPQQVVEYFTGLGIQPMENHHERSRGGIDYVSEPSLYGGHSPIPTATPVHLE